MRNSRSVVTRLRPSTAAWAIKIRSNGSLWSGGKLKISPTCSGRRTSGVATSCSSASGHQVRGSPILSIPFMLFSRTSQYTMALRTLGRRLWLPALFEVETRRIGQGDQGGVGVKQIAVHNSPARRRSSSTGASQPGGNWMRSFMAPRRTWRRWAGLGRAGNRPAVPRDNDPVAALHGANEFRKAIFSFRDAHVHNGPSIARISGDINLIFTKGNTPKSKTAQHKCWAVLSKLIPATTDSPTQSPAQYHGPWRA